MKINLIIINNGNILCGRKKIRGTIEKTYGLVKEPISEYQKDEVSSLIYSTLLLSDDELRDLLDEIRKILERVVDNKPSKERKERRLTFILSPCEKE